MRRAGALGLVALLVAGAAAFGLHHSRGGPSRAFAPSPPRPFTHPVPGSGSFATPALESEIVGEVREAIESAYYRYVPPRVLSQQTIPGILSALDDPYTEYLSPEVYGALQDRLNRRYSGVGLTVSPSETGLEVTSSLDGPARQAGIRPGDVIIAIDGKPTRRLQFDRALTLIQGEEGTVVNLTVRRPGKRRAIPFTVVRSQVSLPTVRSRLLRTHGHRIGYVRLFAFATDASTLVELALERLSHAGAEAVLLDLRGNPGGLLTEAIRVTSLFVRSGRVCSIEGEHQAQRAFVVSGRPVDPKRPMVVLVDEHSASAAEIVTAALADHRRATVVGIRTYGKATVQSLYPLSNGAALRLTTATYVTPAGERIGGSGVEPRLEASDNPLTPPDEGIVAAEKMLLREL